MTDPRTTALHTRHEALGASFTDFGGWLMPVRYTSDLAEHRAVREAAGLFDISHMAEFLITGPDAAPFLDYALAGKPSAMVDGKAKYSLVLSEDGGIVDDVIVYRIAADRFLVVANAANREAVSRAFAERSRRRPTAEALSANAPDPSTSFALIPGASDMPVIEDVTDHLSLVAVQGPRAQEVLGSLSLLEDISPPLDALGYYAWSQASMAGEWVLIARTGYTGEDGFELLVPNSLCESLWDALLTVGAPLGLVPAGLAARDTLRLEAGMPLYGHELSRQVRPEQAGLGRVVARDKADFVGKSALENPLPPDAPVLVGLTGSGRRAGRAGYAVLAGDDIVGEVTSGALSPTLGHPIAMAFVDPAAADPGTDLLLDVRGTLIPATVTALPFYRRNR
ncbi:glycine cleavage system aminomethyltransferase GcvT [Microbacterium xanthum]|uniref:glycine cleavage system aminomethyltransferase GcvT n=1 Tax=Microbacterium xanthum TaxID=3079794 RepID=UPI002AD3D71B|nr:glycine cleavage system aminomethyltransferase GcvT [Microbacterium sp. KSW-48]MDZ8172123.1 glycine cleavage system aminomethyltransferase GcvT [Microbacterium sp. KSW-48]